MGIVAPPRNAAKSVYRITGNWSEAGITWDSKPDFNSSAVANNTNTSIDVWEDYDVTSVIKDIIEGGGENFGFLLKFPQENSYKGARIRSSEYNTSEERPKLAITYESSSGIKPNFYNVPFAEEYNVRITNIQGREVVSFEIKDINQINKMMTSLSSGVHIMSIMTPGKAFNKRIRVVR